MRPIAHADLDAKICRLHELTKRGFYIGAEKHGRGILCGTRERRDITKIFKTYPSADARIDCDQFKNYQRLVLLVMEGEPDHRRYRVRDALAKAGVRIPSACDHKEGLIFAVPRDAQIATTELAPGVWLDASMPSIDADGASLGEPGPLPGHIADAAHMEWQATAEQQSPGERILATIMGAGA